MRIVSWNVFNRSRALDRFESFVRAQDADLYAFQELTPGHIERLSAMAGYTLHLAEDFAEEGETTWLGLFTRRPTHDHTVTAINPARAVSDSYVGRKNRWQECFEAQALTIDTLAGPARAINLHLACAISPRARLAQLEAATSGLDGAARAIVCGDFNSFGRPWLNALVGLTYGFGMADLFTDEVRSLDSFARRHGLARVPARAITFPKFRLHLDHVFLRGMAVRAVRVEADTHGSDHRPVIVDVD